MIKDIFQLQLVAFLQTSEKKTKVPIFTCSRLSLGPPIRSQIMTWRLTINYEYSALALGLFLASFFFF